MDAFLHRLIGSNDEIQLGFVFWILVVATLYSFLIALMYRFTFKGVEYSQNFAQSIVILGVLVAIVISLIGDNVARAFGVFGALSIIRYRVPIKDPKDLTYILAAVVIGLACGVGELMEAGVATLFLLVLIKVLYDHDLWLGPKRLNLPFGFSVSPVTAKSRRLNIRPLKSASSSGSGKSSKSNNSKKTSNGKTSKGDKSGTKQKTQPVATRSNGSSVAENTDQAAATPESPTATEEPTSNVASAHEAPPADVPEKVDEKPENQPEG